MPSDNDDHLEYLIVALEYDPALIQPTYIGEHLDELEGVAVVGIADAMEADVVQEVDLPPVFVDHELPDPVRLPPEPGPIGAEIQRRLDEGDERVRTHFVGDGCEPPHSLP